ncbi:MAG: 4Fe-4S dicluster domain-containing protein [Acidobacteriota bacterium]|jgi:heterodisulfide reductase subunit C|nr:4Fe-4S dicluster domain-containing protein [Acidobacteriota bacterium]
MRSEPHAHPAGQRLAERVLEKTGVDVARCYQCGKCSAGCPLAGEMDYPPSQIMHLLQLLEFPEFAEAALRSHTIWLCLTCEICYCRCPMELDIPKVMDTLRHESLAQNKVNPKARDILAFHRAFLDSVRYTGRLFEMGQVVDYKLRSGHFLQDMLQAPWMFLAGKLHLLPERVRDRALLKRMFAKTLKAKENRP